MTQPTERRPRSRAVRIAGYVLLGPLWALIAFLSINSLGTYTAVGDATVLALIMLFAAWAWWYGEDRDRRRAAKAAQVDADGHPPATS
jgi:hypothetical protein